MSEWSTVKAHFIHCTKTRKIIQGLRDSKLVKKASLTPITQESIGAFRIRKSNKRAEMKELGQESIKNNSLLPPIQRCAKVQFRSRWDQVQARREQKGKGKSTWAIEGRKKDQTRPSAFFELKRFNFALKDRGLQLLLTSFGVIPIERRRIPCFIGRAWGLLWKKKLLEDSR